MKIFYYRQLKTLIKLGMITLSLSVKEITTEEFGHCIQMSTSDIQIIVTIDYGPRIVSVSSSSNPNLIYFKRDNEYHRCHGHKMRLVSEHSAKRFYYDNSPVMYSPLDDGVKFVQNVSSPTPLEVSMDIIPEGDNGSLMVVHSVLNKSKEAMKLSIQTETPLKNDGFIFVPQSNITETDKPSRILTLWNDTKWTDSRLYIGNQYVTVQSDEHNSSKLKIGSNNTAGWCGYLCGVNSFIKRYIHNRTALYPHCYCSTYAASKNGYLSIQTSSPFYRIEPMEIARLVENWIFPCSNYICTPTDERSIDNFINSI